MLAATPMAPRPQSGRRKAQHLRQHHPRLRAGTFDSARPAALFAVGSRWCPCDRQQNIRAFGPVASDTGRMNGSMESLPIIDVALLFGADGPSRARVAQEIGRACRDHGFFYATGHGIAPRLLTRLDEASRAFFALPDFEKNDIAMTRGGPAWRGYFPVGGELTSGKPDQKEGIYFGSELAPDDPRVR